MTGRPACAERIDERRDHEGADGDAEVVDRLDRAEHPGEHAVLDRALEQRVARDVHEDVAHPDQGEGKYRDADVRPDRDQQERRAPEDDADQERHRQAPAACEVYRRDRPDHAADPDGGIQPTDAGIAGPEHLDRDDHEQYGERTGDECLRREEPEDDPQVAVPRDRRDAGDDRLADALLLIAGFTVDPAAFQGPEDHDRREPEADRDEPEDGRRRGDGEEHARDRRAEEEAGALDGRGDDVGRRQLLRAVDERREDRDLRRPEGSSRDSDADAQQVDEPVARACEDRGRDRDGEGKPARVGGASPSPASSGRRARTRTASRSRPGRASARRRG